MDDGYLLTGWTYDSTTTPWHFDVFAHKLNLQGEIINETHFGELNKWIFSSRANGISYKEDEFIQVARGQFDDTLHLWLVWFDALGDTIKTRTYLSPNVGLTTEQWHDYFFPNYSVLTSTGEVYVCSEIGTADTGNDIFVMKTDAEGNELWTFTYSPEGDSDRALSLLPIEDDVILGALTDWDNEGIAQCLFLKLDENGDTMWSLDYWDNTTFTAPTAMLWDGNNIVATSGLTADPDLCFCSQGVIMKIDTMGNALWSTPYGAYADNTIRQFSTLIQTPDSNFVAAGSWWEFTGEFNQWGEEIIEYNVYLIKVDHDNGDIIWERSYYLVHTENQEEHTLYDMKPTPDGGLIFCGEVIADFGPTQPYQQGWVCKLDACGCLVPGCDINCVVSVEDAGGHPDTSQGLFLIGPNPTSDYINIYLAHPNPSLFDIRYSIFVIHDVNGNEVKSFTPQRADTTYIVDTTGLAAGQYVVSLVMDNVVLESERIVVMK